MNKHRRYEVEERPNEAGGGVLLHLVAQDPETGESAEVGCCLLAASCDDEEIRARREDAVLAGWIWCAREPEEPTFRRV